MAQNLTVALIVACCLVYALWTLCPKGPRSRLASALLKLPLPLWFQKPLHAAVRRQGGCGCDGCDRTAGPKVKPGQPGAGQQAQADVKPIAFVPGNYSKKTPR